MKVFLIILTLAPGASWDQAKTRMSEMPSLSVCLAKARDILVTGTPKDGSLLAAGCGQYLERN